MLHLKIGPFHPSLERALAEEVAALSREAPFGRFALVVPSRHLLARVQEALALDAGLTVVGLDAFTFHGLALKLHQEAIEGEAGPAGREGGDGGATRGRAARRDAGSADPARREPPVPLSDPRFLAYAASRVLAEAPTPHAILGRPAEFPGIAAALAASLRDLREAQLDPDRALEAVGEGVFEGDDEEKLVALFRLAQAYGGLLDGLGVLDPAALARLAIDRAPRSPYLASLRRVLYYGFYDLTQQQLDFFAAVAKAFPTTCYFPCRLDQPAYAFAESFYASHLRGLAQDVDILPPDPGRSALGPDLDRLFAAEADGRSSDAAAPPPAPASPPAAGAASRAPALEIWNTAGAQDEVWAVAKEIVGLLDAGVPASEIAVVARTLGPYREEIDRVFRANAIPYWSPSGLPLLRSPVARAVELILDVGEEDFDRPSVVELLASPYLAREGWMPAGLEPRPDLWDLATRRCGIRRGLSDWRRLLGRRAGEPMKVIGDEDAEGAADVVVPIEQIEALLRGVEALAGALGRIPEEGTWSALSDAARGAVLALLHLPADADAREREGWAAIDRVWDGFREWDRLGVRASRREFMSALREVLESESLPPASGPHAGVRVLDAMAARGHAVRVLFLIGLNEKFFPRVVREDPFLRDGPRRKIAGVLGCKMAEKLAGYGEEKLLLAFLLAAARERVVCSYQRADEEGKVQVPSLYLREIRRAAFGVPFPDSARPHTLERAVPRRLRDRLGSAPADRLLPIERGLAAGLRGGDLAAMAESTGRPARAVARAVAAVKALESFGPATPHDGRLDASPGGGKPLSPTALETYALCPFKYFASRRLQIKPLEAPESQAEMEVTDVGSLYHAILETFYKDLADLPPPDRLTGPLRDRLRDVAGRRFDDFERRIPVGYPVAWEAMRRRMVETLEAFVAWDLVRLAEEGFRPLLFEEEGEGEITVGGGEAGRIACRGYMDRVDVRDGGDVLHYRIVDYKSGRVPEKAVEPAALRGEKLQLPVYLVIALPALRRAIAAKRIPDRPLAPAASSYYYLAEAAAAGEPRVVTLGGDFWDRRKAEMDETLRRLVGGIRAGFFLIRPGSYCRFCEYAAICRKGHYPTARRSRGDPGWGLYRPVSVKKETTDGHR